MKPTLSETLAELKAKKFPEFPDNEALSKWVAELAEMDGHVVGLAMQVEAGQYIDKALLRKQFADFSAAFNEVSINGLCANDQNIHRDCKLYILLLKGVVKSLTN